MRQILTALTVLALIGGGSVSAPCQVAVPNAQVVPDLSAYTLAAGDHLKVTVFNEPTLSGDFGVSSQGALSVPLAGDVDVLGLTAPQAAQKIQDALANGYLKKPQVSAEVSVYRPFFVLGEVKAAGQFPYANGMTAMNAVALAGGYSARADKRKIYIRHPNSTQEEVVRISPDLHVAPGDTLRIGERYF